MFQIYSKQRVVSIISTISLSVFTYSFGTKAMCLLNSMQILISKRTILYDRRRINVSDIKNVKEIGVEMLLKNLSIS